MEKQHFYTWVESAPSSVTITVTGGLVYTNKGNVTCTLFAWQGDSWVQTDTDSSTPPDQVPHVVTLDTTYRGLHRVEVWGNNGFELVQWAGGQLMTVEASDEENTTYPNGQWTSYFYVPKGTTVVAGSSSKNYGYITDSSGARLFYLNTLPSTGGNFSVAVPSGQDGKLWKFELVNGLQKLFTVPPYMARNGQELMLPAEVVLADTPAVPATLSVSGTAQMPIVTKAGASARVLAAANTLAAYLNQITGGAFTVTTGDGATGMAVGLPEDFPALLSTGIVFTPDQVDKREEYYLQSHSAGVYVLGATDLAVENAVWDLLYRCGYRQFFPGAAWEVVPSNPNLAITVNARELPDYYDRRYFYGNGTWNDLPASPRYAPNHPSYADWAAKNRMVSGFTLRYSHSYDSIYTANKAVIDAHPEYFALVGGVREFRAGVKFCLSNLALRQLIVDWAVNDLTANPTKESISMEPSDSGGWCECANCAAMGSISDQAVTLANEVAAAVNAQCGSRYVGMNAYSFHSPPPGIAVHPKVGVMAATSFIKGGFTHDGLLTGWSGQGAMMGVYDYFSVNSWDQSRPGVAAVANPGYIRDKIPHWFGKGTRVFCGESSDNWGPCGLGYYLGARFLWDTDEAADYTALRQDFLDRCFGPASAKMDEFYTLIDAARRPVLHEDLLGRMYLKLDEAYALTTASAIRARIDALSLYTRYSELYLAYSRATESAEHQAAAEALLRFAYRIHTTGMVHSCGLWQWIQLRDDAVTIPPECEWTVQEGTNPWKDSTPYTPAEIQSMRTDGMANNPLLPFETISFSTDLTPAAPLSLPNVPTQAHLGYAAERKYFYTWVDSAPGAVTVEIKGGFLNSLNGNVNSSLYAMENPDDLTPVDTDNTVPPDKEWYTRSFDTTYPGLHLLEVNGHHGGDAVRWNTTDVPMTVEMSSARSTLFYGGVWSAYFYVPKGTTIVGGYARGNYGTIKDPAGIVRFHLTTLPGNGGYYAVDVPPGMDGQLWMLSGVNWYHRLLTVPPFIARNAQELLLPREVVEADQYVQGPPPTDGLRVWLMADVGITKDGNNLVSAWADQSGNGNDAVQVTAAKKPLWVDNAVNGLPVLRFDGSSDSLTLPRPSVVGLEGNDQEIFVVAKTSSTATQYMFSSATYQYYELYVNTGSYGFRYLPVNSTYLSGAVVSGSANQYNNAFHLFAGRTFNGYARASVDNVDGTLAAMTLTPPDNNGLYIGSRCGTLSYWNGDIAEVMVYNRPLTRYERLDVEAYLRNKYGL